jgi:hypothetical protein
MTRTFAHYSTLAAALLMCTAIPASAIDLNVGGIGISVGGGAGDGVGVSVGSGGTSVDASVGGGSLASLGASTGGTGVGLAIVDGDGELIEVDQDGNTTNATINLGLGDLLGGGLPGLLPGEGPISLPGDPGGPVSSQQIAAAYGALAPGEQQLLRNRCRDVLANPASFDAGMLALCRIIASL